MKKVLLLGSTGYFGRYLINSRNITYFSVSRSKKNIYHKNHIQLDILKDDLLEFFKDYKFDLILNLITADPNQKDSSLHNKINSKGIVNIINLANYLKIPLIHFSSIAVYNSKKTFYDYGKKLSEKIINRKLNYGIVLRLSAIITPNYPNLTIIKLLKKFHFLNIFLPKKIKDHKLNGPIYFLDVIKVIKILTKKNFIYKKIKYFDLYGPDKTQLYHFLKNKKNISFNKSEIENYLGIRINSISKYI
jgi:dTDP-4-dehydrorhamnose reductase